MRRLAAPVVLLLALACGPPDSAPPPEGPAALEPGDLAGPWRAVLESPGGDLPFGLELEPAEGGALTATVHNGAEATEASGATVDGRDVEIAFAWYDAEIRATVDPTGLTMVGRWRRTSADGDSTLPFRATRGAAPRFSPRTVVDLEAGAPTVEDPSGTWTVVFRDEDGEEPAQGEFTLDDGRVTGTFLTPTGDYRFLEGRWEDGLLRLSTFDGAHAFLFHAQATADGGLEGDFWSRDTYHATWTAKRTAGSKEDLLPTAWEAVGSTHGDGRLSFEFDDLNGNPVSLSDDRFRDRVVLVNLFGSWCPNCNDEAPLLARWHERWRDDGLAVVGLAYEYTGDVERDRRQVRRFAERHGIEYPLLLAGTSDKADAAATLPDLERVLAYPTTIFVGRDGRIRAIHSGFEGPGTGRHHEELVAEMEARIEALLAEDAS